MKAQPEIPGLIVTGASGFLGRHFLAALRDRHKIFALARRSQRIGEETVRGYRDHFPSSVVRLGALFADWCEYPPLFMLLSTRPAAEWNRRILAGKGNSAVPYLHVRDAVAFFERLLEREDGRSGAACREPAALTPDGKAR